jgi:hypothetical protein
MLRPRYLWLGVAMLPLVTMGSGRGAVINAQVDPAQATISAHETEVALQATEIAALREELGIQRTEERVNGHDQVSIGKAWLVSQLQALLQTDRLHLPRTPEAALLAQELLDYEIKVSEDANDRYGAFRVGAHDDLVTALGLAAQGEKRRGGGSGSWLPDPDADEHGPFVNREPWRR